ncbi:GGDEF domain-containing protein [Neiella sp. HB171785]|uniref:diguanylate cyclase n=1 Tax=Neiella litorisoli TaxID=2771431 RepID=A0A8J6QV70_9GAMM|nr:GGDEF domain-containing protein [Neiella litorisoli]MBD1390058.1 GGDEF domain-containing protein [Neiella litorisoli]
MKILIKTEFGYLILLLLTLGLVAWQHFGMNVSYSYELSRAVPITLSNDDINGGRSRGQLSFVDGKPTLNCEIVLSQSFAFCSMLLPLADDDGNGIDLRRFDSLTLTLGYEASERDTLLVYLNNGERINNNDIIRANVQVLVPSAGIQHYTLPLSQFHVPSWWVFSRTEAKISTASQLDNVQNIQISTGDHRSARDVQIQILDFHFDGKWIRAADLYFYLLMVWAIAAVLQIVVIARRFRFKYLYTQREAKRLNEINSFLKIERDKFETLAKQDSLTGCLNRNGLIDILERAISQYESGQSATALILLDIDHFKQLNDNFGHDEGDRVLVALATLLRQHIRDNDHLVRWGGEEFAIVCEQTSTAGALTLAENLRAVIEASHISEQAQVTASFGVAQLNSNHIEPWFKRADESLYLAKHQGRNRVALAP